MRMLRTVAIATILLTGTAGVLSGQQGGIGQTPPTPMSGRGNVGFPPVDGRDRSLDPLNPRMEEQQTRTRNNERQRKLVADTDRLLALATSLKQQVEGNKDAPAVDMVKRAEEIERLAKSVKDRMKG
jgi:hypothetical protein